MKKKIGLISWVDLTVESAEHIKDFYQKVVGWSVDPVEMGGYQDYFMNQKNTNLPMAGVCHKKGPNKDLPSQWLIYITVENLDESIENCKKMGGSLVTKIKHTNTGRYIVIQDPDGAVCALFESEK